MTAPAAQLDLFAPVPPPPPPPPPEPVTYFDPCSLSPCWRWARRPGGRAIFGKAPDGRFYRYILGEPPIRWHMLPPEDCVEVAASEVCGRHEVGSPGCDGSSWDGAGWSTLHLDTPRCEAQHPP